MTRNPEPASPPGPGADGVDWSVCTWKGSRLEQRRSFLSLSFREKMEALEGGCELSRRLMENRRRQGRPFRDPYTGEIVRPTGPALPPATAGEG